MAGTTLRTATVDDKLRVGVLVSGSGSNLQAHLDAAAQDDAAYDVVGVISNRPGVFALERAARADVPHVVVDHQHHDSRAAFEAALVEQLQAWDVELVVLAGFMRVLRDGFLQAFRHRVVNVHPALCPSFPGMHAPRQALQAGVRVTGCTVHVVDEGVDTGPILEQAVVPVLPDDDESTLVARIQQQEHQVFPQVVQALALGQLWLEDGRVRRR